MKQCKTCKWRDRCDLDCGDPQGFSYTPTEAEDERGERWEEDDYGENKEDNNDK